MVIPLLIFSDGLFLPETQGRPCLGPRVLSLFSSLLSGSPAIGLLGLSVPSAQGVQQALPGFPFPVHEMSPGNSFRVVPGQLQGSPHLCPISLGAPSVVAWGLLSWKPLFQTSCSIFGCLRCEGKSNPSYSILAWSNSLPTSHSLELASFVNPGISTCLSSQWYQMNTVLYET